VRIANDFRVTKKDKYDTENLFYFSFSPYRRINCSTSFLIDRCVKKTNYSTSYSLRNHRFEASLRIDTSLRLTFPRLRYGYKLRNLAVDLEASGKDFDRLFCSIIYYFDCGRASENTYYNSTTKKCVISSRFSGSAIITDSNIDFHSDSLMRQSKALVLVFLDKNFNGIFEKNIDEPLEEAKITINSKTSCYKTSANGMVWVKVSAQDKAYIGVENESLPTRAFVNKLALIKPFAQIAMKVEIPVYVGGEIIGTDKGDAAEINLLDKNEKIISTADVYSDGMFYFNNVIPGEYFIATLNGDRKKFIKMEVDENGTPKSIYDLILENK